MLCVQNIDRPNQRQRKRVQQLKQREKSQTDGRSATLD